MILTDIVSLRQPPKCNTLISHAYVLLTITGPLIGGLVVQHTTWRWISILIFILWCWTCADFLRRSFEYRECFAQTKDISGRLSWRCTLHWRHNALSACYYLGWCAVLLEKFANHGAPCSGCSGDIGSAFMGSLGPPSKAGIVNSRSAVLTTPVRCYRTYW